MRYYKSICDDQIIGIGVGALGVEISFDEYEEIKSMISSKPTAPFGYTYMLQDDPREWVLVELPPAPEEEAEIEDYEAALADLGVRV
jgi:hypothetical protein